MADVGVLSRAGFKATVSRRVVITSPARTTINWCDDACMAGNFSQGESREDAPPPTPPLPLRTGAPSIDGARGLPLHTLDSHSACVLLTRALRCP